MNEFKYGVHTYGSPRKFSIWKANMLDMMPAYDGRGNPLLWWSKCHKCNDYVVCGLRTKTETLEVTDQHFATCDGSEQ